MSCGLGLSRSCLVVGLCSAKVFYDTFGARFAKAHTHLW